MGRPKGSKNGKEKLKVVGPTGKELKEGTDYVETKDKAIKMTNPKLAKLKTIINEANKKYGENTIKLASDEGQPERSSFGNPFIDQLTGGGVIHGKFTVMWGGKSTGKSTAILKLIATAQAAGKVCCLIDAEASFDPIWATKMGVNLETLVLCQGFKTAEDALDTFIKMMSEKAVDLIIIDSVSALSPKEEQETSKGKELSLSHSEMALMARKLSKFFRISTSQVRKANCAVVLVGQTRTNLGGFIAFEQLSGGNALAHYASLILSFKRGPRSEAPVKKVYNPKSKENETVEIGFDCVIKIDKTKVASQMEGSKLSVPFYFEKGFGVGDE